MLHLSLNPALGRRPNRARRGALDVLGDFVRQWWVERRLRHRDGSFRSTDLGRVLATYGAMSAPDFEAVNGPQGWLNEHIIPRVLRAHRARGPWRVVDLGCGSGGSAALLARHAPRGSSLLGYDVCPTLVERARARAYRDATGAPVMVHFVCQSITERLQDPSGGSIADASVDVAHSAGVVGHHLSVPDLHALAAELRRVLTPDGIAILDSGPRLVPAALERVLAAHGFTPLARHRLLPFGVRVAMTFGRRDRLRRTRRRPGALGHGRAHSSINGR
jgi:SAM-dependent methyltransferase